MATRSMKLMNPIVRHLRRAVVARRNGVPDSRLLETFCATRDEAAFEVLVKRHGPMVLGVCQRVLGNLHDAEDAFQAVFLVLANKAGSIARSDLLGNWLYGVAYRTALQARVRRGRRRARELQVKDMPHPTVSPDAPLDLHELHRVLDRELSKLADKYRVPIVLCDLEGRSRKQAAGQLQIPEGTLSSRLATGRQLLARRLGRQGLALSGAALLLVLTQQTAPAALRTALVAATVRAAALTAAGQSAAGLVSAQALALSQGALKTMLLHKLKLISSLCLGVLVGTVGAGLGMRGLLDPCAVRAAQGERVAQAGQARRSAADDPEPVDGALLLDPQIQADLRLSKNQITKLQAVSQQVDGANGPRRAEIQQLQKRIEELQRQVAKLREGIEGERKQALSQAAPGILSARAMGRLREIHRQRRGLRQLVQDPKVQRLLQLDDEQSRKIEDILKKERPAANRWNVNRLDQRFVDIDLGTGTYISVLHELARPRTGDGIAEGESGGRFWRYELAYAAAIGSNADQLLLGVLTDAQKRMLFQWVGEPYRSPSWQALWDRYRKSH